jgi:hypothetical protein
LTGAQPFFERGAILSYVGNQNSLHARARQPLLHAALALLVGVAPFAAAQTPLGNQPAAEVIAANTHFGLPDSPGTLLTGSSSSAEANFADPDFGDPATADPNGAQAAPSGSRPKAATHLQLVINPGEVTQPMSVRDKIVSGITSQASLFSATGWLAAAGWEQLTNGSPNYGTDSGAFGQRLGAAALRGASEGIFSNSLFAPLFHEDPRYYVMGAGHPFFKRLVYAGTRAIITRSDSGHTRPNFSLLAGNAAGSALTIPYYPAQNTSFKEVAETFGGSVGGSALGFVVDEFIIDALIDLHIKKKQQQQP